MQTEDKSKPAGIAWHAMKAADVLDYLHSDLHGISDAEAAHRLERFGTNRLPEAAPRSTWRRFLLQFHNVLIYVLLAAAVVTLLLQHWVDTAVIVGVVIINAVIGVIQEGKAENALAAIRDMLSPRAAVIRDGRSRVVAADAIVPGDIVPLQPGDKVVADMRLLSAHGLQIDEAALTGESLPVDKDEEPCDEHLTLADRRSMAYSGTLVTSGQATCIVVATGATTELGQISNLVASVEQLTTPLLRQMNTFSRWLSAAIVGIATATFAFGVLVHGYTVADMFLAAVGLAVAAIPEGLPAIMTITLAIGVQRMAGKHAIIRRLPAVETLGTLSVICSDKTGTLTRNEMTVRALALADGDLDISGAGYDPHGGFSRGGGDIDVRVDPAAMQMLTAMALCNDASTHLEDGHWQIHGDPMESALNIAAIKAGLDPTLLRRQYPRDDLVPFDSAHGFMATLHHGHDGHAFAVMKGAPERVLARCGSAWTGNGTTELDHGDWERRVRQLGEQGYRVLAVARKAVADGTVELTFDSVADGLELIGLAALMDPPRAEAIEAVATCLQAGIQVKMITGDHLVTALAIARQVGLRHTDEALTGTDIDIMGDDRLLLRVQETDVFARVTPEHKLRLVQLLQRHGHVVSMTGDGVNDAPALRRAEVGIAMGANGTEVAKESAEMVLTDDNFATIVSAIEEGRTVYDNLRKAILFILPTNGGEALVMLTAIILGVEYFPLTPAQILWVNMITAATLALALAFEPAEKGLMQRPPRRARDPILTPLFLWRILFVSLILVAGTFGLFQFHLGIGASIEEARTIAVNALVVFEIFYLFNSRYIVQSVLSRQALFGNPYVLFAVALLLLFQLGFTYLPFMQQLFGTASISAIDWLQIVLVGSSVFWLVEFEKMQIRDRA